MRKNIDFMEDETPLLKSPASAQRTPHKTSAARLKELRSARDGFMASYLSSHTI